MARGTSRIGRRSLLLGAAAAAGGAAWWGWPRLAPLLVRLPELEPLDDPPGFRRIAGRAVSAGIDPLIGLADPESDAAADAEAAVRANLCAALFGAAPPEGTVPVASFSDYNCPYCRVLTEQLADRAAASDGGVTVTWHEWPLLGPTSRAAARAALAADMQGAYPAFHKRLMRTRVLPTPAYLDLVAEDIGIDPVRLRADMNGAEVDRRLRVTAALARIFGFPGTPSLVVGRTVVIGAVSDALIGALIRRERRDGPPPICA